MKKIYVALYLFVSVSLLSASSWAFEIGARGYYWFPSLDGNVTVDEDDILGTNIDFDKDLGIDDYADLYIKMSIKQKDSNTSALYAHWIRALGYTRILRQLSEWKAAKIPVHNWKMLKIPYSRKKIDKEYPRLLKEELAAVSGLLRKIKRKNEIIISLFFKV